MCVLGGAAGKNTLDDAGFGQGGTKVKFVILGRTELRVHGQSIDLGATKQRGLLALLLYHVGVPVRIDVLLAYLWPDRPPAACRANLHTLVSRLRAVLIEVGLPNALVRIPSTGGYRLDVDPGLVDLHRFRRALTVARETARDGNCESAVALLSDALAIWQDEPLADLRGAPAEHLRTGLEATLLDAYKCLVDCQLKLGQYYSVLARLEPILQMHVLDEALAQAWINALCATDRESDARAFLIAFRQRFRKAMRTGSSIDLPHPYGSRAAAPVPEPPAVRGPRQVPTDITDFTGQQDLLHALDALADPAGTGPYVMVVSGMPGAGKTTLAVHWAHGQRHRFPDGQLYLNAGAYGPAPPVDPADALGRFLSALEVPLDRIPADVERRRDRLNQLLADRRMLIVLDNVRDSEQVRLLLPTSSATRTLITSRNRLRGLTVREGVRHLTVAPLPEEACRELFSRVIGAGRAHAEPAALAELARLSGGLPLAVRVIGEHVAARSRARISDLVEDLGTHLLDCEGEDDEETTLRNVFAWSHLALRADAANLLQMLGLYPGETISAEAAAALTGSTPQQTEPLLNSIAKAHLINHDTARRYRFHDLVRRYAADQVAREQPAPRRKQALRQVLDWFLLTAANAAAVLAPHDSPVPDLPSPNGVQPLTFGSDAEAMRWCAAERSNLGAVTRWAFEHGWYRHGWQIPGAVHEIFDRYGRRDDVRALEELALRSARLDGHQLGELGILNNLAATYFLEHDYASAGTHFAAGLALARALDQPAEETICAHNLASVYLATADLATAVRQFLEVLQAWRDLGHAPGESSALHHLGDAYRLQHRYDEAARYYREALLIRERIGSLRGQGESHSALAALYLETGEWQRALGHCDPVLALHDRTKDDGVRCDALITMADVQRQIGGSRSAIRTARLAVGLSEDIADSVRRCRALTVLAHALATTGHIATARRVCAEALMIVREVTDPGTAALRERLLALRNEFAEAG